MLSVQDAAALIAGFDPHSIDESRQFFRSRETGVTDSGGITGVHTGADRARKRGHGRRPESDDTPGRLATGMGRRAGGWRSVCAGGHDKARRCGGCLGYCRTLCRPWPTQDHLSRCTRLGADDRRRRGHLPVADVAWHEDGIFLSRCDGPAGLSGPEPSALGAEARRCRQCVAGRHARQRQKWEGRHPEMAVRTRGGVWPDQGRR
ncbi:hypothetical protein C7405_1302 [Paraburkholderia caballeronis]|nr:hypothetical protein C7405_1302 [Paraburkholderia caballeronis]